LLIIWSCNRGLDLFDESLYLLETIDPSDSIVRTTAAPLYLHSLFAALNYDVTSIRVAGLMVLLSSTIFLTLRAGRLVDRFLKLQSLLSKPGLTAFGVIGAMLYYFWFIRSPSYNLLIVAGSYLFVGFVLWSYERAPERRVVSIPTIMAGVTWSACLFVKFPSALALAGITGVSFVAWHGWSWRQIVSFSTNFAVGATIWTGVHFICFESPVEWFSKTWGAFQFLQSPGFPSTSNMFKRYVAETGRSLLAVSRVFSPAILLMAAGLFVAFATSDKSKARRRLSLVYGATIILFTCLAMWDGFYGWQFTAIDLFYFYLLIASIVFLTLAAALTLDRISADRDVLLFDIRRLLVLSALLLATPFAESFGTGNPITVNAILGMAPWFIAMAILLHLLACRIGRECIARVVILVLAFVASGDVVSGAMHPYGIYATIFEQTSITKLGAFGHTLRLDPPTSSYIKDLRDLADRAGIISSSDILFFYDSPGSVLAIGAHSPGRPWFFSDSVDSTIFLLSRVARQKLRNSFILIDLQTPRPPDMAAFEVNFPKDYDFVGEVLRRPTQHRIQLWRPRILQ
jgi:hypothetical protein